MGTIAKDKKLISDLFLELFDEFNLDISYKSKDTITGNKWLKKLGDSKFTLGAESGASTLDYDGNLMEKFSKPFKDFFKVNDDLNYTSLSPRVFEAIGTKTCIIQFEGFYSGILKPNIHYLSIKRDLSNIEEIKRVMNDDKICSGIINNAYNDIVCNSEYHYKNFIDIIFSDFKVSDNFKEKKSFYILIHQLLYLKLLPLIFKVIRIIIRNK